ncbi:hypothetical protein RRF57_011285 [Xylaria bambusicola]|uniref:Uncharacterized protein n=1 Tax=Xylaria bambusicola TaxID=326684 RepID=A0AAN7ZE12_9PEZI
MVSAAPETLNSIDDSEEREDSPQEKSERDSGLGGLAARVSATVIRPAETHGYGDGAGEPEDGCDDVERESGETVEYRGHVERYQPDVGEDQE